MRKCQCGIVVRVSDNNVEGPGSNLCHGSSLGDPLGASHKCLIYPTSHGCCEDKLEERRTMSATLGSPLGREREDK